MKTLYFVRHAKSSWKYDLSDHQRPLKRRGVEDANHIGKYLKARAVTIDHIASSDARRASATAVTIAGYLSYKESDIEFRNDLYDFSGDQVDRFIRNLDDLHHKVMLFGHNPAFTLLANEKGTIYLENLPTAGVVAIQFDTNSWQNCNKGTTLFTIFPKQIR